MKPQPTIATLTALIPFQVPVRGDDTPQRVEIAAMQFIEMACHGFPRVPNSADQPPCYAIACGGQQVYAKRRPSFQGGAPLLFLLDGAVIKIGADPFRTTG